YASVRGRARQAACANNLRQIALAGMLYVQDNDDRFPSCYPRGSPPYYVDPRTSLQPYIKNWSIFYCPDRHTVRVECLDPMDGFRQGSRCMGYGYNWGSGLTWGSSYSKADGLVRRPADRSMVVVGVTQAEVADPAHCFF